MSTGGSGNYRPFFLPSWSSARVFPLGSKNATLSARLPTAAAAPTMVAIAARTKMASCAMAITPFGAPPASDLAGDESHSSKTIKLLTCVNAKVHLFSCIAAERQCPVSRVLGRQAPASSSKPRPRKKIEKNFASRARVFISRARFASARMRPRAVARRDAAAKSFVSNCRGVACAATARRRRGPTTEEVPRCSRSESKGCPRR